MSNQFFAGGTPEEYGLHYLIPSEEEYAGTSQDEIGPATATAPPANTGTDPGEIYRVGPRFVDNVQQHFQLIERALTAVLEHKARRQTQEGHREIKTVQLDSNGAGTVILFETNPGQKYALHRLYVHVEGYTASAPYTGTGSLQIQTGMTGAGGTTWSSYATSNGLPALYSSGRLSGVEAQDGESMLLKITGGPASTRVECRLAGVLGPISDHDE